MTPDFPTWLCIPSPNKSLGRSTPVSGIVIHFTAAGSGKATADYFSKVSVSWTENGVQKTAQVQASAHLVIDRDGTTYQCVPFTDTAWHAGPAQLWKGKPKPPGSNVNSWTIGIEIANWGELKLDQYSAPPALLNYLGKAIATPAGIFNVGGEAGTLWENYAARQIDAVIAAIKVIVHKYPNIKREDVTGHENIQSNKHDPGPAFPWRQVLDAVFEEEPHQELLNAQTDENRCQCLEDPEALKKLL